MDRIVSSDWFATLWKIVCLSLMVPMYFSVNYARDHGWDHGWGAVGLFVLIVGWMAALMALAGAPFWIRWPKHQRRS